MKRINNILPTDKTVETAAHSRWNSIAKPLGSLGLLETAIEKIAAVQHTENVDISKRTVVVMCADNGVVSENISQSDSSVTAVCTNAIANGTSNINVLAHTFKAEVIAVDMGVDFDFENPKILDRKIAYGTKNIAVGAAMTTAQAELAISTGMDIVSDLKKSGSKIIVTGEMGIGNTTTASALSAVLLDLPPYQVTGRGAGLDSERLKKKIAVIERAVSVNKPDKRKPVDLLSKLGGFDIAGMVGIFLGGAYYQMPVVIDGVISAAAAVLACMINPLAAEYMFPSHISGEPAGKMLLDSIGLKPLINAEMRLGEGTGGVMLLPLLDGALAVYNKAHRFDEIEIERYAELK